MAAFGGVATGDTAQLSCYGVQLSVYRDTSDISLMGIAIHRDTETPAHRERPENQCEKSIKCYAASIRRIGAMATEHTHVTSSPSRSMSRCAKSFASKRRIIITKNVPAEIHILVRNYIYNDEGAADSDTRVRCSDIVQATQRTVHIFHHYFSASDIRSTHAKRERI